MTMNIYTDPKLLDVQGAIDVLPELPLNNQPETERAAILATGTENRSPLRLSRTVAPTVAPKSDKGSKSGSTAVKMVDEDDDEDPSAPVAVSVVPDKRKDPLTTAVNESLKSGRQELNLRPLDPQSGRKCVFFGKYAFFVSIFASIFRQNGYNKLDTVVSNLGEDDGKVLGTATTGERCQTRTDAISSPELLEEVQGWQGLLSQASPDKCRLQGRTTGMEFNPCSAR